MKEKVSSSERSAFVKCQLVLLLCVAAFSGLPLAVGFFGRQWDGLLPATACVVAVVCSIVSCLNFRRVWPYRMAWYGKLWRRRLFATSLKTYAATLAGAAIGLTGKAVYTVAAKTFVKCCNSCYADACKARLFCGGSPLPLATPILILLGTVFMGVVAYLLD